MTRSGLVLALLLAVVLAVGACRRESDVAAPPSATARVVTLSPSATEVVAALGATAELVGVDEFSAYPPEVTRLPKVGAFLSPNVEVIVGLHPTLVIVDDVHTEVAAQLAQLGIPTARCVMHTLPDVKDALTTVGHALHRDAEAAARIAAIDHALDAAAAQKPAQRPRVLVVIDHEAGSLSNLVAAGSGTWLDELLAVAGGGNVLSASGVRYPKIGPEEVLRAQPDVILDVAFSAGGDLAPWQSLEVPAVAHHRVVVRSDAFLLSPSPRVAEALAVLHDVVAAPATP